MIVFSGLTCGGVERDGEVARVLRCDFGWGGEAEDVGGLVLVAELLVQALDGRVGGEQDLDFAAEAEEGAGAIEEARQGGFVGGKEGRSMVIIGAETRTEAD